MDWVQKVLTPSQRKLGFELQERDDHCLSLLINGKERRGWTKTVTIATLQSEIYQTEQEMRSGVCIG